MSCITYHLESSLREEARALAGQGMSLADRPARTQTAAGLASAALHPGVGCNSSRASSQVAPSFTVNREGDIVSLETGEVDPVLTAQLAMGIR